MEKTKWKEERVDSLSQARGGFVAQCVEAILLEDLTIERTEEMVSLATKRKMKAKDDKMLTLERYFESYRRDFSRCLS